MSGYLQTPQKAVQITKTNIDGAIVLNKDAIEQLFGNGRVRDSPVCIYSISGPLRKGKSLFMALMLRYLRHKEKNEEATWKGDKNATLEDGFQWSAGLGKSHTQGIYIWSKPCWLETSDYGTVAVFLMDTQGLFAEESQKTTDRLLFTLSTYLSSVQIYNLHQVITSNDLENLESFSLFFDKLRSNDQMGSYQSLHFLMRDWQDTSYTYGYTGGKKYLDEKFEENKNRSSEFKALCLKIKNAFQTTECALLPHPGFILAERNPEDPPAKLGDVRNIFLEVCEGIFRKVFYEPVVKKIGCLPLTGTDVANMAYCISNIVEMKEFGVDAMYQVYASANLQHLTVQCEENFFRVIKEKVKEPQTPENLHQIHLAVTEDAIEIFRKAKKIGGPTEITDYENRLKASLKNRYFMFQSHNENLKADVKMLYSNLVEKCLKQFNDHLKIYFTPSAAGNVMDEENFQQIALDKRKRAIEKFEEISKNDPLDLEIKKEFYERLETKIDTETRMFRFKNDLKQVKIDILLRKRVVESLNQFMWGVQKGGMDQKNIVLAQESAENYFKEILSGNGHSGNDFRVESSLPIVARHKEKLKTKLTTIREIYSRRLSIDEVITMDVAFPVTFKAIEEVVETMQISKKQIKTEAMQTLEDNVLETISRDKQARFSTMITDMCENELQLQRFQSNLDQKNEHIKVLEAKVAAIDEIMPGKPNLMQKIRLLFQNDENVSNAAEIQRISSAISGFEKKVNHISEKNFVKKTKESLENNQDILKQIFERKRQTKKKECHTKAEKIQAVAVWGFCQEMYLQLCGKSAREHYRIKLMNEILSQCKKEIGAIAAPTSTTEELLNSLSIAFNTQMTDWKLVNKFHRDVYSSEVTSWEDFKRSVKKWFKDVNNLFWKVSLFNETTFTPPESWKELSNTSHTYAESEL